MKVLFEASFEKDLRRIKDTNIKIRIKNYIEETKLASNIRQIKNIKKLKEYDTYYRIRMGDFRIGLEIIKDEVIFTRFLHRKDIYKYFP